MNTYLTNELVARSLAAARVDDHVVDSMTSTEFNIATAVLAAALFEGSSKGHVTVSDPDTGSKEPLASFFRVGLVGSPNEKILAFSFSSLASEGLFPIIGLAVSAFSDSFSLSDAESVVTIGRSLWNSMAVLRSPEDDDALQALRALSLSKIALAGAPNAHPTNTDIAVHCALAPDALAQALASLDAKKIIKPAEWGSVVGRYEDPKNRWALRI